MNLIDKNFISIRFVQKELIDMICKNKAHEENIRIFNEIVVKWHERRKDIQEKK